MEKLNKLLLQLQPTVPVMRQLVFNDLTSLYLIIASRNVSTLYYYRTDFDEPKMLHQFQFNLTGIRLVNQRIYLTGEKCVTIEQQTNICSIFDYLTVGALYYKNNVIYSQGISLIQQGDVQFMYQAGVYLYVVTGSQLLIYYYKEHEQIAILLQIINQEAVFFSSNYVFVFGQQYCVYKENSQIIKVAELTKFANVTQIQNLIYFNCGDAQYVSRLEENQLIIEKIQSDCQHFSNGVLCLDSLNLLHYQFDFKPFQWEIQSHDQLLFVQAYKDKNTEFQMLQQIDENIQILEKMLKDSCYLTAEKQVINAKEVINDANQKISKLLPQQSRRVDKLTSYVQQIQELNLELSNDPQKIQIKQLIQRIERKMREYEILNKKLVCISATQQKHDNELNIEELFKSAQQNAE